MRDVTQVCFLGFSILIERAAVAESERYLLTDGPFSFQNIVNLSKNTRKH